MDAFAAWLQATPLSQAILLNTWIWPLCETLHFIGLSLLIGIVGCFDLRLLGFFRAVPARAVRELMPFALGGFLLNFITGCIFLIGLPGQYVNNRSWWMKVLFLAIAGLNAAIFERVVGPGILAIEAGDDTTLRMKITGAVSLIAWLGVLYWGRMLPFIGNAY